MKLRIAKDSIIFRLNEEDAAILQQNGEVIEAVPLSDTKELVYKVIVDKRNKVATLLFAAKEQQFELFVSEDALTQLMHRPTRKGLWLINSLIIKCYK